MRCSATICIGNFSPLSLIGGRYRPTPGRVVLDGQSVPESLALAPPAGRRSAATAGLTLRTPRLLLVAEAALVSEFATLHVLETAPQSGRMPWAALVVVSGS